MKTKILEQLKTKFIGVSDQTLSRMAEKAAKTVTTDEELTSYIDGMTFQLVIDSEADYRATKASQTSVENYEKKYNIKEGKPISQPSKKEEAPKDEDDDSPAPKWAQEVLNFIQQSKETQKAEKLKGIKKQLVEKLIEKGADKNDRGHIENLIEIAGISEDVDLDEKSDVILGVYNSFKKSNGTKTPGKTDDDIPDDEFDNLLKASIEK